MTTETPTPTSTPPIRYACGVVGCRVQHRTARGAARCQSRAAGAKRTTHLIYARPGFLSDVRCVGEADRILHHD